MFNTQNMLFIAPHPDDEVLGCGGTIKRYSTENKKVYILIVTRGKKGLYSEAQIQNVREEAIAAHNLLGVSATRFLDFPAPELDQIPGAELSKAISKVIQEFDIDTVFLPHRGDIHNDHKVVFNSGLVASRPVNGSPVKRVFSYETLSETEWAAPFGDDAFIPTFFVDITSYISYKIKAMECFKSQLREFPNSRSIKAIEALSNFRGSTTGFSNAEAFMTVRIIQD